MSNKPGLLFVISSPSGAGKTTLCKSLRQQFNDLHFSVSYTTRDPRPSEVDGVDYHFVDTKTFETMVEKNAFAEWAFVHGNRYGTTLSSVRMALDLGQNMLFDVDYQGAESLRSQFENEARLIYVLPPSLKILSDRLSSRGTESQERIRQRLSKAKQELTHYPSYQYLVLNDKVDQAVSELSAIYRFERAQKNPNLMLPEERDALFALSQSFTKEQRTSLVESLLQENF